MNDYDDFGFDDYSSGTECPMCCGSLVHDGICYECGADIDAARSAMGLDSYADHRLDTYLQSLQPRSATKTAADFLNETGPKRRLTPTCYACLQPLAKAPPRHCQACQQPVCPTCGACGCPLKA